MFASVLSVVCLSPQEVLTKVNVDELLPQQRSQINKWLSCYVVTCSGVTGAGERLRR